MIVLIYPIRIHNSLKQICERLNDCDYVSGYLCNPKAVLSEFEEIKRKLLLQPDGSMKKETGNLAYHLLQSFPKGLEISDEEVHQCGIELCEKINAHQAVICSHIHSVESDFVNAYGKCKHNHILINAYIHPSKLDPNRPKVLKYNDSNKTYAQLRAWNDEIAIEHGLPIIRNPVE